jgi:hypothetical protein
VLQLPAHADLRRKRHELVVTEKCSFALSERPFCPVLRLVAVRAKPSLFGGQVPKLPKENNAFRLGELEGQGPSKSKALRAFKLGLSASDSKSSPLRTALPSLRSRTGRSPRLVPQKSPNVRSKDIFQYELPNSHKYQIGNTGLGRIAFLRCPMASSGLPVQVRILPSPVAPERH